MDEKARQSEAWQQTTRRKKRVAYWAAIIALLSTLGFARLLAESDGWQWWLWAVLMPMSAGWFVTRVALHTALMLTLAIDKAKSDSARDIQDRL